MWQNIKTVLTNTKKSAPLPLHFADNKIESVGLEIANITLFTPISIFLDPAKVFDTLDYDILFKLKFYGITSTPCKWLCSYLSDSSILNTHLWKIEKPRQGSSWLYPRTPALHYLNERHLYRIRFISINIVCR